MSRLASVLSGDLRGLSWFIPNRVHVPARPGVASAHGPHDREEFSTGKRSKPFAIMKNVARHALQGQLRGSMPHLDVPTRRKITLLWNAHRRQQWSIDVVCARQATASGESSGARECTL